MIALVNNESEKKPAMSVKQPEVLLLSSVFEMHDSAMLPNARIQVAAQLSVVLTVSY